MLVLGVMLLLGAGSAEIFDADLWTLGAGMINIPGSGIVEFHQPTLGGYPISTCAKYVDPSSCNANTAAEEFCGEMPFAAAMSTYGYVGSAGAFMRFISHDTSGAGSGCPQAPCNYFTYIYCTLQPYVHALTGYQLDFAAVNFDSSATNASVSHPTIDLVHIHACYEEGLDCSGKRVAEELCAALPGATGPAVEFTLASDAADGGVKYWGSGAAALNCGGTCPRLASVLCRARPIDGRTRGPWTRSEVSNYKFGSHREVALAAKWATKDYLDTLSESDKRVLVQGKYMELATDSHATVLSWSDQVLWENLGLAFFLLENEFISEHLIDIWYAHTDLLGQVKQQLHMRTDVPMGTLDGESTADILERCNIYASKARKVTAITTVEWHLEQAYPVGSQPELIGERVFDNCNASFPLTSAFAFSRTISKTTKFTTTDELNWHIGIGLKFTAEIPFVGSSSVEASVSLGGSHSWTHGEDNAVARTFSVNSAVAVPEYERAERKLIMTIDKFKVPYTMTVQNTYGATKFIRGVWDGVTLAESQETQFHLPCSL